MGKSTTFDPAFDFLGEANGADPDRWSPTLRAYHHRLWNRRLPNGVDFSLDITGRAPYLHSSALKDLWLTSDAGIPTWKSWTRRAVADVVRQVPEEEVEAFYRASYEMGGMILFPCTRVDGQPTINQARGWSGEIADRLDLTVECIRLHYAGEPSPLSEVLDRYTDFFSLFETFRGYIEFFLLQDLVAEDFSSVRTFRPFQGFDASPLPANVGEYREYRDNAIRFIRARNSLMVNQVQHCEQGHS